MTKEFENFKNILGQKQNELDIQARNAKKAQDDEFAKKQLEDTQKQIESDQRATENKSIFENSGVVNLFEEIRDSGLVKCNSKPIMSDGYSKKDFFSREKWVPGQQISNYHPAKIIWGKECEYISLLFNESELMSKYDSDGPFYRTYDCCSVSLDELNNNVKISNLQSYIANKLIHPDHIAIDL